MAIVGARRAARKILIFTFAYIGTMLAVVALTLLALGYKRGAEMVTDFLGDISTLVILVAMLTPALIGFGTATFLWKERRR